VLQPGERCASHVESQLRGPSGQRRPHASGESGNGGGGGDCWSLRRRARMGESVRRSRCRSFKKFYRNGGAARSRQRRYRSDHSEAVFSRRSLRTGLKAGLFIDWRRNPDGSENKDFVLKQAALPGARRSWSHAIISDAAVRARHAVWALDDAGFRAAIAPEFADIFHNNCMKNGFFLPITLKADEVDHIFSRRRRLRGVSPHDRSRKADGVRRFSAGPRTSISSRIRRSACLEGLDDIALTLAHEDRIVAYEKAHPLPHGFE